MTRPTDPHRGHAPRAALLALLLSLALAAATPAHAKDAPGSDSAWSPPPDAPKAPPPLVDAPLYEAEAAPIDGIDVEVPVAKDAAPLPPLALSPQPPANDNVLQARVIPALPYHDAALTQGATTESGEPLPCGMGATTWYVYTASVSGTATFTTKGANFDTVLAAYTQAGGVLGSFITCNDDFTGAGLASQISFSVAAGRTYYVQAGGWQGSTGALTLNGAFAPCADNNNRACATAIAAAPYHHAQATTGFTLESGEPRPCGGIAATAWFRYAPAVSQTIAIDTGGSSFDTVVAVYVDNGGALGTNVACNDDVTLLNLGSAIRMTVNAGQAYYIQVGGYYGATGALSLTLAPCTNNDYVECATPLVQPSSVGQSTSGYGTEAGEPTSCAYIGATAWFKAVPTSTVTATLDTTGSNYDTVLVVYEDSLSNPVGCNDDSGGFLTSHLVFTARAGHAYYIQAGGYYGASGALALHVS